VAAVHAAGRLLHAVAAQFRRFGVQEPDEVDQ
jgi:hypothetical protein